MIIYNSLSIACFCVEYFVQFENSSSALESQVFRLTIHVWEEKKRKCDLIEFTCLRIYTFKIEMNVVIIKMPFSHITFCCLHSYSGSLKCVVPSSVMLPLR